MAKDKKGAIALKDKGSKGYACGGKVKMAQGGAAKSRKNFPMTKAPKKK